MHTCSNIVVRHDEKRIFEIPRRKKAEDKVNSFESRRRKTKLQLCGNNQIAAKKNETFFFFISNWIFLTFNVALRYIYF